MVVCIIVGVIGAGIGILIATGGSAPRYIIDILGWIFILSWIPVFGFICSRLLDDTSAKEREALRHIKHESPRVLMPEFVEHSEEEMIDDEILEDE